MKTALSRFAHLFMAVAVLLSSTGFGLVEHSCQMRGNRVYSIHDAQPVCKLCRVGTEAGEPMPSVKRAACCKVETHYSKVDTGSSLSHSEVKFNKSDQVSGTLSAGTLPPALFGWPIWQQADVPVVRYASPPPLSGRQLLAFMHTLLI